MSASDSPIFVSERLALPGDLDAVVRSRLLIALHRGYIVQSVSTYAGTGGPCVTRCLTSLVRPFSLVISARAVAKTSVARSTARFDGPFWLAAAPRRCLPPSRDLAHTLAVSPMTVIVGYERLAGGGSVMSRLGAGTFVSELVWRDQSPPIRHRSRGLPTPCKKPNRPLSHG